MLRLSFSYQIELRNRDVLNLKRRQTMSELLRLQEDEADQKELTWFHLYINRLAYEIAECEKRLLQLESEIQSQKEVLIEASKKRKTLTTMKDRQKKEYVRESDRQEQKEIDELVVSRFGVKEPDFQNAGVNRANRKDVEHE